MTAIPHPTSSSTSPYSSALLDDAAQTKPETRAVTPRSVAPAVPTKARDEVTLSREAKAWMAEQKGQVRYQALDINTLRAVMHDTGDIFSDKEQEEASRAASDWSNAWHVPLAAHGQATGDFTALGRAVLEQFDNASPEEQARQGGPARRAEIQNIIERLERLKDRSDEEDKVEGGNLLTDILERLREQSEAYEVRLAERAEAEAVKQAAVKADLAGESTATDPSATTPAILDFKAYAAPTLAAAAAATTTVEA